MVKYFIYAIFMEVIYLVIGYLHSKDDFPADDKNQYVVKVPSAFTKVFKMMFWFGTLLFFFWNIFFVRGFRGEGKITAGHLIFALAVAGIGFLLAVWGSAWRITVDGSQVIVHRLLRKEVSFSVDDVDAVRQVKQTKMGPATRIVIKKDGKKIAVAEWSCENYDRFEKNLIEAGKLQEGNK